MRASFVLAVLGVASCGGLAVGAPGDDAGSSPGESGQSSKETGAPVDSGTAIEVDGAALPKVGSSACDERSACVFCSDHRWHCNQGASVVSSCPIGTASGVTCRAGPIAICYSCASGASEGTAYVCDYETKWHGNHGVWSQSQDLPTLCVQ